MGLRFRINDNFNRQSKNVIDKFKDYAVANLGDAMDRMSCISASNLKPINNIKLLGTAYTVKVVPGDNLMIYYAIDNANEGDIIVIDGARYNERALVGEILLEFALSKNIGGFVVNGAIRDYDALLNSPIPIYYTGISANGPYKNGPGEINYPISIDGIVINPGDILVGDGDGIITIRENDIEDLLSKVNEIQKKESSMLEQIHNKKFDIKWMYDFFEKNNIKNLGGK